MSGLVVAGTDDFTEKEVKNLAVQLVYEAWNLSDEISRNSLFRRTEEQ